MCTYNVLELHICTNSRLIYRLWNAPRLSMMGRFISLNFFQVVGKQCYFSWWIAIQLFLDRAFIILIQEKFSHVLNQTSILLSCIYITSNHPRLYPHQSLDFRMWINLPIHDFRCPLIVVHISLLQVPSFLQLILCILPSHSVQNIAIKFTNSPLEIRLTRYSSCDVVAHSTLVYNIISLSRRKRTNLPRRQTSKF